MPELKQNESESEYISRCVKEVMKEGKTQKEALGQCYGMYRSQKKKSIVKGIISNLIKWSKIRKNMDSNNNEALIPQNLAGAKKKRGLKDGSGKGKGMPNGNRKNQNLIPCKEKNRGLGSGKNRE